MIRQKNFSKGFEEAFDELKIGEREQAEKDLMQILGIKNRSSFWHYKKGHTIPPADKAQEVENYFKSKGVKNVY